MRQNSHSGYSAVRYLTTHSCLHNKTEEGISDGLGDRHG
jgi:hypothetical protein